MRSGGVKAINYWGLAKLPTTHVWALGVLVALWSSEAQYLGSDMIPTLPRDPKDWEAMSQEPHAYWKDPTKDRNGLPTQNDDDPDLPKLTKEGEKIRTILLVSLITGVCRSPDWRGDLPKYLVRLLPNARVVKVEMSMKDKVWSCIECLTEGTQWWDGHHDCGHYFGLGKAKQPADLLIVIGSGYLSGTKLVPSHSHWPEVRSVFNSGYVDNKTISVHFPAKKADVPNFPFTHVIPDTSYMKPLDDASLEQIQDKCSMSNRQNDIMYVGRFVSSKGQDKFLETVDPRLLEGYTVHFYGSFLNAPLLDFLPDIAKRRGISIAIHQSVSKAALLDMFCSSSGLVHFASDNNPRVPYEGVSTGNPLFTTYDADLHSDIYKQSFVTSVYFNATEEEFNQKFRRFMSQVRREDRSWETELQAFVRENLQPRKTYLGLCELMGICAPAR